MKNTEEEKEFIGMTEALEIAKKHNIDITVTTAIKWIKNFGLGHQPGGRKGSHWIINARRWEDFITGKWQRIGD